VGADFVGDGRNGADCNGHGTHVAGTIGGATFGAAKSVRLVAVRVFGCTASTKESVVISAVDWITGHGVRPAVVNMSLGSPVSEPLDAAVRGSIAAGFTYTVSAGNTYSDPNTCDLSPARVAEAITVAASTRDDQEAQYTNNGPCVDMFAPGGGVYGEDVDPTPVTSAWYTSDTATASGSGTSMAAPHVAGAAALFLAWHPTATPSSVQSTLVSRSSKGILALYGGFGTPNRLLYSYPPMLTVTRLDATPEPVARGGVEVLRGYVYRSATGTRLANRRVNIYFRRAGTTTWSYRTYRITNSTGNYLASFHQYNSGTWLAVHVGDERFHLSSASDTVYVG
jgi:subtilisin family serine protease